MVGGGALGVGVGNVCGDWGVLALVMDFREVMVTSPPELAHCGGEGGAGHVPIQTFQGTFCCCLCLEIFDAGGGSHPNPNLLRNFSA